MPYAISTDGTLIGAGLTLFNCSDYSIIDDDSSSGPSGSLSVTAPADGIYYLSGGGSCNDATTFQVSLTATCSDVWVFNPVIALWDDSGTTRQLWACPTCDIPAPNAFGGGWGSWYASLSDATTALANQVRNCVGIFDNVNFPIDSFTATNGGSSLALQTVSSLSGPMVAYCGLNAEVGETISIAFSGSVGTITGNFFLYDYDGNIIDNGGFFGTTTSPIVSIALPYTGQYTLLVIVGTDAPSTAFTADATVTSSGAITFNPISALYDIGLTCPARLDCS